MDDVTRALSDLAKGGPDAQGRLLALIYGELKRMAQQKLRGQSRSHTLQPTALVHEAYLKLLGPRDAAWKDRRHFFAAAAAAMRSILVDHARRQRAGKRSGSGVRVTLHPDLADLVGLDGAEDFSQQVVEVHETLDRLAGVDPRKGQVVELMFFGGLSVEEAAEVLSVSARTVKRDWRFARAWLLKEIRAGE